MNRTNRLLAVFVVGVGAFLAFTPTDAAAMFETKLSCSGDKCCTYDDQTGHIYSCVIVREP